MSETDFAQAYLAKKFPGFKAISESELADSVLISKKNVKTVEKYLKNEIKGANLSKNASDKNNHVARASATRFILMFLELSSDEEISAISTKANVRLTDEEKSLERAIVACTEYMTAYNASPEFLIEELKKELREV